MRRAASRGVAAAILGLVASAALALPVFAWQAEGGYRNCGEFISYLHARYNDGGILYAPGGSEHDYYYYDGLWHVTELNGGYAGDWSVLARNYIDFNATYTGCRPYG